MPTPLIRDLFCLLLLPLVGQLGAQDPFFSQFYANPVYLNPAYAGLDPGTQLTLNHRDQWFGFPQGNSTPFQGGFRTTNVTVNQQLPCFGGGQDGGLGLAASFFQDQTGTAPFTTSGGSLAASFEYGGLDPNLELFGADFSRLDLRIGAQFGRMQSRIDADYLIYSFQLDPVEGLGGQLPGNIELSTGGYNTFNLGGMIRGAFDYGLNGHTIFTLGASVSNVNEPSVSLFGTAADVPIPRRTTVHLGWAQRLSFRRGTRYYRPTYIAPQFRWDSQYGGELNLFTMGAYLLRRGFYSGIFYQFNSPNQPATNTGEAIGGRNAPAIVLSAGFDMRSAIDRNNRWRDRETGWIVGISYDIPTGGTAGGVGSIELNFRILLVKQDNKDCDALGKNELYKGATCPVSF